MHSLVDGIYTHKVYIYAQFLENIQKKCIQLCFFFGLVRTSEQSKPSQANHMFSVPQIHLPDHQLRLKILKVYVSK